MSNMKLQAILKYAADTVPYYKVLFEKQGINCSEIVNGKHFAKIPILTKDIVQNLSDEFISTDFLRYPKRSELMLNSTSGSSGKCLQVKWSGMDYMRSMFPLWMRRGKIYGINTSDKLLSFHTNIFSGNVSANNEQKLLMQGGRVLSLSNLNFDKNQVDFYYKEMMDFNPTWLSIQPSVAFLLADYVKKNNRKLPGSLRYIELTGEYLFDHVLNKIKEAFPVPIANMYGMVEVNGIAHQCKNGNMHILNSNVFVEVLDNNKETVDFGEKGEIFVTSLTNMAMPLIRYGTGDRGILFDASYCTCGSEAPVLSVKAGRISEFADARDGEKLTPHMFCYPVTVINDDMGNPIKQFQVIQNDVDDFLVTFTLEKSFNGWENSITKYYRKLMGDTILKSARWHFAFKDAIYPEEKTGKYKFFINKTSLKENMCI